MWHKGFITAAESPAMVVLVRGSRSVLLPRVARVDEDTLHSVLHAAGLASEALVEILARDAPRLADGNATAATP